MKETAFRSRSTTARYTVSICSNNPVFGLNALGGAVSLQMKSGFLWQGLATQIMGGSYGRVSGQFEYGKQIDDYSLYVTADATHDGGWRFFSPSSIFRLYGDLGYRTPGNELHFIASGASSNVGIVGATPILLLDQDFRSVFTSPQFSLNQGGSLAFTGKFDINSDWTVQSNFYLRSFQQRHVDANDASIQDCSLLPQYGLPAGPAGKLCDTDNGSFHRQSTRPSRRLDRIGQSFSLWVDRSHLGAREYRGHFIAGDRYRQNFRP
jgi:iron complex outermembrane recepter protein